MQINVCSKISGILDPYVLKLSLHRKKTPANLNLTFDCLQSRWQLVIRSLYQQSILSGYTHCSLKWRGFVCMYISRPLCRLHAVHRVGNNTSRVGNNMARVLRPCTSLVNTVNSVVTNSYLLPSFKYKVFIALRVLLSFLPVIDNISNTSRPQTFFSVRFNKCKETPN